MKQPKKRSGRPKNSFVNTKKKEPTEVIRVRKSIVEAVKKLNSFYDPQKTDLQNEG